MIALGIWVLSRSVLVFSAISSLSPHRGFVLNRQALYPTKLLIGLIFWIAPYLFSISCWAFYCLRFVEFIPHTVFCASHISVASFLMGLQDYEHVSDIVLSFFPCARNYMFPNTHSLRTSTSHLPYIRRTCVYSIILLLLSMSYIWFDIFYLFIFSYAVFS